MPLTTTLAGRSRGYYYLAYDSFTRGDAGSLGNTESSGPLGGAIVRAWQTGGATWAIVSGEAVNTPTEGGELVVNGDFANWTGDNPDNWTVVAEDANNYVTESAGGGEAQIVSNNTAAIRITQNILTIGAWYACSADCTAAVAGSLLAEDTSGGLLQSLSAVQAYSWTGRAASGVFIVIRGGVCDVTFDNVSIKQLTLNTLFSSVETSASDIICQAELDTVVAGTQAGLVVNLDDKDAPANFVIAYHNGTNARLEKCVAGTYTSVINAAVAYAAGATIQVVKSGTSYSLYYNSAQVGATQTISDAGIVSNTKHGLFSTDSGNQLDNFQCVRN